MKKLKVALLLSGTWFLIISTPFIPEFLVGSLESQYRAVSITSIENSEKPVEILILGGGHKNDLSIPPTSRLTSESLARLIEGIRIYSACSESRIILSGTDSGGKTTQADMLFESAIALGIEREQLVKFGEPDDTWEEVSVFENRLLNWNEEMAEKPNALIIVTSAIHMPRAMKMANYLLPNDLEIIASPSDYRMKSDEDEQFEVTNILPSIQNMIKMKIAMREYAGLAEFYLILKPLNGGSV